MPTLTTRHLTNLKEQGLLSSAINAARRANFLVNFDEGSFNVFDGERFFRLGNPDEIAYYFSAHKFVSILFWDCEQKISLNCRFERSSNNCTEFYYEIDEKIFSFEGVSKNRLTDLAKALHTQLECMITVCVDDYFPGNPAIQYELQEAYKREEFADSLLSINALVKRSAVVRDILLLPDIKFGIAHTGYLSIDEIETIRTRSRNSTFLEDGSFFFEYE